MTAPSGRTARPSPRPADRPAGADRARRPRRRATWLVLAAVLALLLTGAAEAVARGLVADRVADRLRNRLGDTHVEVDGLALAGLARSRFDGITVTGDQARLGRLAGASVDLRLTGVDLGGTPRADHVRGAITVPPDAVAEALRQTSSGLPVTGVTPDPASGTLVVTARGGLATVTLRPALRDGRVTYQLQDARVLGLPAPDALTRRIEEALKEQSDRQTALQRSALLTVTSLRVTSAGVVATLSADDVALADAAH
ncbi:MULTISPECIES: DUF2993 domain-containing protein [unclassified Streptomyces]|uniref:DUF2993 domain-containing protein n=1 Tax=unclassified Streptomyces TaxID=2593676 RepID=UPI001F04B111|nr:MULTISPECIES: DUF2993 domain-containing protein [unclassified Streptomyces]MCH0565579.1 hypothetical protein [Streptomyces sp. MUM 2J]MCH0572102.1 hypothetical protein [Streptomyces sp. MUM 136J]